MDNDVKDALEKAKQRLKEALPGIKERNEEGQQNSTEEPDVLRSGHLDEVGLRREIKEQDDEKLP